MPVGPEAERSIQLRMNTIEETYELADAILDHDLNEIRKELGDLLLHVVFYSKMGSEQQAFDLGDVANGICDKLVFRHPHVFGDTQADNAEQVKQNWEDIKLKEKAQAHEKKRVLSGVPRSLPAMVKAYRIGEKAASAGFDWEKREDVWAKVREETAEVETRNAPRRSRSDGRGVRRPLLRAGQRLPALRSRSRSRTRTHQPQVHPPLHRDGGSRRRTGRMLSDLTPDEQEALWQKAKQEER